MDRHDAILASIAGLDDRLSHAGVAGWLEELPTAVVEGRRYFVLGDRLAGEAEAKLAFAVEHGLVSEERVSRAAADQPLPADVEAVEIKTDESGDS